MLILDTCVLLWLASAQEKLSEKSKEKIKENADALFVSAISAFEIAIKEKKKKLSLPMPALEWFTKALDIHGIHEIPVDKDIAVLAVRLPNHHNDPCDRFIIATALKNKIPLLTPDKGISMYKDIEVVW